MVNVGVIGCGYWGPNLMRSTSKEAIELIDLVKRKDR